MPLLESNTYTRPKWLFNGHLETIYPSLFRKVTTPIPLKERISTADGDFLDLYWYRQNKSKVVIISHGLEGNSTRAYMLGMVNAFLQQDYDVLTWNFRSCSDEMNKQLIFYHSGATYDLDQVVKHVYDDYLEINLVGFSLGGNLTLKYLGEKRETISKLHRGVGISVPLHLSSSSKKISQTGNILYSQRFLRSLKKKVIEKSAAYPGQIPLEALRNIKTLTDFDDLYTGPLHGFTDAEEYYDVNSSLFFLDQIKVPTLVLNALNDPFLTEKCFPTFLANSLENVFLEFPKYGGHVGFSPANSGKPFYSEYRAVEFISGVI